MSDSTKTIVFDGAGSSNTFDPNYLLGMMSGNGGFGGFGNGSWIWVLFLFALFGGNWGGFGGNGYGGNRGVGFLSNQINEDTGRQLVMQAINGNANAISQLASSLNCATGDIQNALCSVQGKISDVANQVGMSSLQVVNAIDRGDAALASQLASCCCDLKGAVKDVAIGQERGFSSLAYATQQQTCAIEKSIADSTQAILAGQAAIEKRELQREIATLQEEKQTYKLGSMIAAATNPILAEVESIKCKLPRTETVNVQPQYIPVNYGVNVGLAPYNACSYGCGYAGWNNGSLWG